MEMVLSILLVLVAVGVIISLCTSLVKWLLKTMLTAIACILRLLWQLFTLPFMALIALLAPKK